MNEPMTLSEWLIIQQEQLQKFAEMFRDGQNSNPEHFPTLLPHGEWDEQFRMFEI